MKKRFSLFLALFVLFALFVAGWQGQPKRSVAAPAAVPPLYLPALLTPPIDFTITGLEISQAIQKTNNSMPMVAGKDTVVRVFAQTVFGSSPGNVTISLSATRGGTPIGTLTDGPKSVPAAPSRATYSSTSNFVLPANWLSGSVIIVATVDSAGVVAEASEANNTSQINAVFNVVPDLDVMIVPVNYTHQGGSNPGFYPGQAVDNISDWIARTYPVANVIISFRSAYDFTGNLDSGNEWSRLLDEITDLKPLDGAPSSQIYYALVPVHNGSTQWFFQGIAGIGWICCTRASVGLNLGANENSGILAAHEIGHNLRRSHAPCGVSNPDQNYPPYVPSGSIGEYGLDIQGSSVSLINPSSYKDMMSYCGPEWISDYTYDGLYSDQVIRGILANGNPVPGLMIRASLDAVGTPQIGPVYAFPQLVTAEAIDPDYVVELLDDNGRVLTSHGVQLYLAEEPGVSAQAIHASVPLPKRPVAAVRLLQSGVLVAERQMRRPAAVPATTLVVDQSPGVVKLTWNAAGVPAVIRYSADDGQSWTALAVDVMGGAYQVDPAELAGDGLFQVIMANSADGTGNRLTAPFTSD